MELPLLLAYCDGSCPKPNSSGGAGWVVLQDGRPIAAGTCGLAVTTNQRAELVAAINVVRALPIPAIALVRSDSQYVVHGMTGWRKNWERAGWRTREGKDVANQDLWRELCAEADQRCVSWEWVRGHVPLKRGGDPWNDRVDRWAVMHRQAVQRAQGIEA